MSSGVAARFEQAEKKREADLEAELMAAAREHGSYMGIGVCTYAEICGLGPSQVAGAVGFGGG